MPGIYTLRLGAEGQTGVLGRTGPDVRCSCNRRKVALESTGPMSCCAVRRCPVLQQGDGSVCTRSELAGLRHGHKGTFVGL